MPDRTRRDRVPAPVRDVVRRGAVWFGARTAGRRLMPGLLVVGAQRSGTTTLFRLLSAHPQLARPTYSKGIGYFDLHYDRGPDWYRGHFPMRGAARRRAGGDRPMAFESSGYYLFHPAAAGRIGRDLPGVRVVAMLRDPVERAWSAWKHESARGFEDEPFDRAIALEERRLAGEEERLLADPSYVSHHHRHHAYVGRGQYTPQLDRMVEAAGREHVLALDFEAFFREPHARFTDLCRWLGIADPVERPVLAHNARPSPPMDPALAADLRSRFSASDRGLVTHLGHTPTWRDTDLL